MKTFSLFIFLLIFPLLMNGQQTIQNNTQSFTIEPTGITSNHTFSNSTNLAIGKDALSVSSSSARYNTAIGGNSLKNNSTGASNSYEGSYNTALGYGTLETNTTGADNCAIGVDALNENLTGSRNVGIGTYSLKKNSSGSYNIAIGYNTLVENLDGNFNIGMGYGSLRSNISGGNNVGYGSGTLSYDSDGNYNTAMGDHSLFWGTNISYNTAIGGGSLEHNQVDHNTALGYYSLNSNETGTYNTGIGENVLENTFSGSQNVAVGYKAGHTNVSGSGNVFLGYKAGYNSRDSNKLYIDNSDSTDILISGDFSTNKVGINRRMAFLDIRSENFQVDGDAFKTTGSGNWVIPSDRRLKENIVYLNSNEMLNKVLKMNGVTFEWKDKRKALGKNYGFIAQELQEVFPENVKTDKEGFLSASYGNNDAVFVEAIKALYAEIQALKSENKELSAMLKSLSSKKAD